MEKIKNQKRFGLITVLAVILMLCMTLGLLSLTNTTAYAATGVTDGVLLIDSSNPAKGDGWDWDGSTLTLSGIDMKTIKLYDASTPVTIVLEGQNRLQSDDGNNAIDALTDLTIKGSGSLELSSPVLDGIYLFGAKLTIESGYIKARSAGDSRAAIYTRELGNKSGGVEIKGGYLEASGYTGIKCDTNCDYIQSSGYVKAIGRTDAGLTVKGTTTITGGYLEALGAGALSNTSCGITTSNFSNAGGVVKAIGGASSDAGINSTNPASFTGGVTIAKGSSTAIQGKAIGSENYWLTSNGTVSGSGYALSTTATNITSRYLVFAKLVASTSVSYTSYDGMYYYSTSSAVSVKSGGTSTFNGGNYIEVNTSAARSLANAEGTVTVNGTLVCINSNAAGGDAVYSSGANSSFIVNARATVYGYSKNAFGFTGKKLENAGNVICESNSDVGITANIDNTGYIFGCAITGMNKGINASGLTNRGGYITAISNESVGLEYLSKVTFIGGGEITAIGGIHAYNGVQQSCEALASTVPYAKLTKAVFNATSQKYNVGDVPVQVLLLRQSSEPTFDNGLGKTDCTFDMYTKGVKDATIGYTFVGWFNGDAELTDSASAEAGRTYTAKWTNNGKTVRNEILDLSNMTENAARESEGWAWNATTKTLTLNGLTIDVSVEDYGVLLPDGATVVLQGKNVINNSADSSMGIYVEGKVTFKGTGSLDVAAVEFGIVASSKSTESGITVESGSVKFTADGTQGVAVYLYTGKATGKNDSTLEVKGGSFIAIGTSVGVYGQGDAQDTGATYIKFTGGTSVIEGAGFSAVVVGGTTNAISVADGAILKTGTNYADNAYVGEFSFTNVENSENEENDAVKTIKITFHTCVFDKEIVADKYLKSAATCDSPAVYYKSCDCGEASTTETFISGEKLAHVDANNDGKCDLCDKEVSHVDKDGDNKCDICGADMSKGLPVGAIVGIVIGGVLLLLAAAYACGYFFLYKKGKLDGKAIAVIYGFLKK